MKMILLPNIVFIIFWFKSHLACRAPLPEDLPPTTQIVPVINTSGWGAWTPPKEDASWKEWVKIYAENSSRFDSTEEGRDPESGWPRDWKGLGKANEGVPPPPWAYIPLGYGKPQYCFLQPAKGNCEQNLIRWGYNPSKNECQQFTYSGCGANQNNFLDIISCRKACVETPSTGCEAQEKVNFEEMIFE